MVAILAGMVELGVLVPAVGMGWFVESQRGILPSG